MKPVDSAIMAAAVALVSLVAATPSVAGSPEIELQLLVSGLDQPVVMTHANDGSGRLFIVEQDGAIRIWDGSQLLATPFLDIDPQVTSGGERGLLGLAFHPDYANNGWFFVYYSGPDPESDPGVDHNTVVSRFSVQGGNPNQADPASETEIFRYEQPWSNHNGGQIAFGPDGFLYIGLGDGGLGGDTLNSGQRVDTLLGKILRMNVDGDLPYEIPADNPFVGEAGLDEIWAFGLRNPWRFSFDRTSGDLFIGDVGQNAWEEIDYQPASSSGGENYGWRCYEGDHPYNTSGCGPIEDYVGPIFEYPHAQGCSITGGFRYRGSQFPNLAGTYLYGDYCSGVIWGGTNDGGVWSSVPLLNSNLNISSFGEDEDGELYVTDHVSNNGAVYRIIDTSPTDSVFGDGFESGDTTSWSATQS